MNQNTIYTAELVVPVTAAPLVNGALLVRDNRIVAIGRRSDIEAQAGNAATVDFGASILLPPLVNAHTHLELTDFPDWRRQAEAEDPKQGVEGGFVGWILALIRIKHALAPEQLEQSVRNGLDQLLRSGTGAVCDVLSIGVLDRLYRESPLFGWLCYELIGLDDGMGSVLPAMADDWLREPSLLRLQRGLSPHSPYTVGPQSLAALTELARKQRVLATVHVAESPDETRFLATSDGAIVDQLYGAVGWRAPQPPYGQTPGAFVEQAGATGGNSLLVHGVQFDAATIRQLAKSETSLVLCPRSNARLDVGRAPVESLLCQGVNLALGTDSLASNDSLSLWDEMAFLRRQFDGVLAGAQIVAMATVNGARALQLEGEIGALEPGWGVNFQVLLPNSLPSLPDVADFLCQPERTADVKHLFLGGVDVLA